MRPMTITPLTNLKATCSIVTETEYTVYAKMKSQTLKWGLYLHLYFSSIWPLHINITPTLNDKTLILPLLVLQKEEKKIFSTSQLEHLLQNIMAI